MLLLGALDMLASLRINILLGKAKIHNVDLLLSLLLIRVVVAVIVDWFPKPSRGERGLVWNFHKKILRLDISVDDTFVMNGFEP